MSKWLGCAPTSSLSTHHWSIGQWAWPTLTLRGIICLYTFTMRRCSTPISTHGHWLGCQGTIYFIQNSFYIWIFFKIDYIGKISFWISDSILWLSIKSNKYFPFYSKYKYSKCFLICPISFWKGLKESDWAMFNREAGDSVLEVVGRVIWGRGGN